MSGDTDTSNSYDRMDSGEESEDLEDSGEECGFADLSVFLWKLIDHQIDGPKMSSR